MIVVLELLFIAVCEKETEEVARIFLKRTKNQKARLGVSRTLAFHDVRVGEGEFEP